MRSGRRVCWLTLIGLNCRLLCHVELCWRDVGLFALRRQDKGWLYFLLKVLWRFCNQNRNHYFYQKPNWNRTDWWKSALTNLILSKLITFTSSSWHYQQIINVSNLNKLLRQITDETEKPDVSTSMINQCFSAQWNSIFLFTQNKTWHANSLWFIITWQ